MEPPYQLKCSLLGKAIGPNVDLHSGWCQTHHFLLQAFGETWEHGATACQQDVGEHILSDIDGTFHDGLIGHRFDSPYLLSQDCGLEYGLRADKALLADSDHLPVRKLILFLLLHLLAVIQRHVAQLFLDVTNISLMSRTISCSAVVANL